MSTKSPAVHTILYVGVMYDDFSDEMVSPSRPKIGITGSGNSTLKSRYKSMNVNSIYSVRPIFAVKFFKMTAKKLEDIVKKNFKGRWENTEFFYGYNPTELKQSVLDLLELMSPKSFEILDTLSVEEKSVLEMGGTKLPSKSVKIGDYTSSDFVKTQGFPQELIGELCYSKKIGHRVNFKIVSKFEISIELLGDQVFDVRKGIESGFVKAYNDLYLKEGRDLPKCGHQSVNLLARGDRSRYSFLTKNDKPLTDEIYRLINK